MKPFPVVVPTLTLLAALLAAPATAQPPSRVVPVVTSRSATPAAPPASPVISPSPVIPASPVSPVSPVSSPAPTSTEPPVNGSVLGSPATVPSGTPVYSPFGYITNGYYKSGGVFVGGNGSFPFDSGNILLGGTDGLARVSGSYQLVVMPGAAGNSLYTGCGGSLGPRYR